MPECSERPSALWVSFEFLWVKKVCNITGNELLGLMSAAIFREDRCALRWEKYSNCNQLIMDIFSTQIVAAIKKIRTQKGRSDSDKNFKEVVKEWTIKITLEDIQQALQHMVSDGKLINTPHKGCILVML